MTQQSVMSNLTYLLDRGWVKKHEVHKTVVVNGGTIPSTVTWYRISAAAIDKIEGGSEFEPKDRYEGINVTATGQTSPCSATETWCTLSSQSFVHALMS